ncbi:hypothetical protein MHM88_08065 [Epibacterium sp. MM17-32]|uniref:hypothetical protein n=1 Tax=Epibacterium sp. MM17-32 TaxID=2917734 RepID=UPI001EF59281|nr:hypothetical protein [Epibacterium sp. MM17-32]MCG7627756.1 hypothetical protein [Epibacterium sp. MM17-32]
MKINYYVVRRYLSWLTEGRAASDPDRLDDWENYEPDMDQMIREAREAGDEVLLKRSLDSLIADPDGRIDAFAGQVHGFDEDDLVALFTAAFDYLWPDEMLSEPGAGPALEFVPMSDEEWAARQGQG